MATVSTTMITVVAQAMELKNRLLVNLPIKSVLLISSSMKMSTNGSSTPFTTWENTATFNNGKSGSRTTHAPTAINTV